MTDDRRNLVITGFMGTGKSSVARAVAERLGRSFVDMDELIVQRAGMSIPEIFQRQGEGAFRQFERELCGQLGAQRGLVIATGGGALVDEANRRTLGHNGCLVCLDCEAGELLHRLCGDRGRPMLWADDPEARLRELLRERQPAYARIPYHVDTTHRSLQEVVAKVAALFESNPRSWSVATPTGPYGVHLLPGGLADLGALLRAHGILGRTVVVSDEHVWPLYGPQAVSGLRSGRYDVASIVLPAGEQHKTLDTVRTLYDRFVEAELDRSGAVVALGGGVITDMVGFAAATYMRGIPTVQAPTSLLGMVDASVGGKVAVDHPRGKNLVGAFMQPLFVLLVPETLETLPEVERRAGLAEVIKAGIIADAELFSAYEADGEARDLRWAVERALQVKIDVVEADPYEKGRRAVLNLGHTFAHALEVLADYELHHGLAVSMGMAAAAHLAEIRGLCSRVTRERIVAALERNSLPTTYAAHPPGVIYQAMRTDKKRQASRLRFVLPRGIGDVVIDEDVSEAEVILALERIRR